MEDLSRYRLTDWAWVGHYKDRMGAEAFRDYMNRVYAQLLRIPVGGSFRIDERVRPENRELFVKIGCMFIQEGHTDYDFNDTFTIIRHHEEAKMEPKRDRAVKGKPWQKVVQRDREDAGKV